MTHSLKSTERIFYIYIYNIKYVKMVTDSVIAFETDMNEAVLLWIYCISDIYKSSRHEQTHDEESFWKS